MLVLAMKFSRGAARDGRAKRIARCSRGLRERTPSKRNRGYLVTRALDLERTSAANCAGCPKAPTTDVEFEGHQASASTGSLSSELVDEQWTP